VAALPSARGDGMPITSFIELDPGARVEHVFAAAADDGVLLSTRAGFGLLCQMADLQSRNKAGRQFLSLEDGDAPLRPATFDRAMGTVVCIAGTDERVRMLSFPVGEVKVLKNGGRGVILVGLDKGESLLQAIVAGEAGVRLTGVGRGAKAIDRVLSAREIGEYKGARARKGQLIEPRVKAPALSLPRAQRSGN
jgi:topoisomerase IV subunit A